MAMCQSLMYLLTLPHRGQAPSHIWIADRQMIPVGSKVAALLLLISGAPLNHAGRTQARCRVVGQERFAYF
ncbi:hypothetical protein BOP93_03575 [Pseudomonas orientalis]|uniref:Uncharacterized protein n=1 Tax=Pseudomonas orientalis TaxID=76758 RepID=A0A2L0RSF1_9PSED|nr:hypothetical protein BOP93_03575 [Pseudomonas orientalis]